MIAGVALGGCVCGHLRSKDQLSLDKVEPSVAIAGVCTPLLLRGNGGRNAERDDAGKDFGHDGKSGTEKTVTDESLHA